MVTLTKTSVPNFYDVLSSNLWDHYPLQVKEDNSIKCGCMGFTVHGHCYHADDAVTRLTFQEEVSEVKPVLVPDTDAKEITCPICGAWMMAWAWVKHLQGNFCELYIGEKV